MTHSQAATDAITGIRNREARRETQMLALAELLADVIWRLETAYPRKRDHLKDYRRAIAIVEAMKGDPP